MRRVTQVSGQFVSIWTGRSTVPADGELLLRDACEEAVQKIDKFFHESFRVWVVGHHYQFPRCDWVGPGIGGGNWGSTLQRGEKRAP